MAAHVKREVRRGYDNSLRAERARLTRRRVIETAGRLFTDVGYHTVSIARIAQEAGVSQQLIYQSFGSKRGVLSTLFDWTIAGDDRPVPLVEREHIQRIQAAPRAAEKLAIFAEFVAVMTPRVAPLFQLMRATARTDPDVRDVLTKVDFERRAGMWGFAGDLLGTGDLDGTLTRDEIADSLWALVPDVIWNQLVVSRQYSVEQFRAWYVRTAAGAVGLARPSDGD